MNLLEYAIQMEKDGEKFYRQLAAQCADDEGMRFIFDMLADDEVKHRQIFEEMQSQSKKAMEDSKIIVNAVTIFKEKQKNSKPYNCSVQQAELYKEAYDMELKSYNFYMDKLAEASSEAEMTIIHRIAKEEKRHAVVLESIIDMVTRPDYWIENAEFNHMEQY